MTGIRKTARGWQAFVRVHGRFRSKRFPPDTGLTVMKQWREEQRVRARLGAELPESGTTFGHDVKNYLEQVATMPTFRWRKDDLALWLRVFGAHRIRQSITSGEIRAQLETWRAAGYAASTCNHRRTALMHLWSVLDGKSAPNPARDVQKFREVRAAPRALPAQAVAAVFKVMRPSATKARLELMAWTGWPPAQIMRLEPAHIDWKRAVYVTGRQKGSGVPGRWLPLLPQAWTALRAFKKQGAWGQFSTSAARAAFRRAAKRVRKSKQTPKAIKAALENVTPYMLRHTFGTLVALTTRDDTAVQELMLHADPRQSRRYTEAAVDPRILAAVQEVAKQLPRLHYATKH